MWNTKAMAAAVLFAFLVPIWAKAADAGQEERRMMFGLRMNTYPSELFKVGTVQASTSRPAADYTYTGSVGTSKSVVGPAFEYRLPRNFSLVAELHVREAKYTQTTEIRNGRIEPGVSPDNRNTDTFVETTSANYWEVPVLAVYSHGIYYVGGGLQLRYVGQVRTGTEYSYADGATDYSENPARKERSNQLGAVFSAGLRLVDTRRIRVKPEIRYVRWRGTVFQGLSYRSASSQVEASIGFMF